MTAIIPPALLALVIRPLSMGVIDFLPAGPTPIIFAILAQYHAIVPRMYSYKIALSRGPPPKNEAEGEDTPGLEFTDKSTKYLFALQLALFQWPGSLLGALVGWVVGYAWRNELLPGRLTRWRVPGWVVGVSERKKNDGFEGIRRRLEGEETAAATGSASGVQQTADGDNSRRRTMGQQLMDEVRGAL